MTPIAGSGSDAGATNTEDSHPSATEGAEALRNDLSGSATWERVEALAALLEPEAFDPDQPADEAWREVTRQRALSHAAKVITSGYLRVVEDDDDILNVIASALAKAVEGLEITSGHLAAPFAERPLYVSRYLALARAVVRALRDAGE